jgi:hypothetical protein
MASVGRALSGTGWLVGSGVGWLVHRLVGLPELVGSLVGLRPRKRLRLRLVILRGSGGAPLVEEHEVQRAIQAAKTTLVAEANVVVEPPVGEDDIVEVYADQNPTYVLRPECNWNGFKHNFTEVGRWFRATSKPHTDRGGVVVFVAEDVRSKSGCFMGLVNFGYVDPAAFRIAGSGSPTDGPPPLTLAHELGHGCDLMHRRDPANLMAPSGKARTGRLSRWQRAVLRSSRHVRYR